MQRDTTNTDSQFLESHHHSWEHPSCSSFLGSAPALRTPTSESPAPTLDQLPGQRPASPSQHKSLATCLRPVSSRSWACGPRPPPARGPQTQAVGRGGRGLGARMHLLNKRRPPVRCRAAAQRSGHRSPQLRGSKGEVGGHTGPRPRLGVCGRAPSAPEAGPPLPHA